MGWFEEQIKQRKNNDDEAVSEAFLAMEGAVKGKRVRIDFDNRSIQRNSIEEILRFYGIKPMELPDHIEDINDQIEYLMRPSGIMRRRVRLKDRWYKDADGPMLGKLNDNTFIALIPSRFGGYTYMDNKAGKRVRVNKKIAKNILENALLFYKPLPLRSLELKDIFKYMTSLLKLHDILGIVLISALVALANLLVPQINNIIFSKVIMSEDMRLFYSTAIALVCISLSVLLFGTVKELIIERMGTRLSVSVEAATMMRVLSLPVDFFRQYSSGELASRTQQVNTLCNALTDTVLSVCLTVVFSLVYIVQIFRFAPTLVLPAIIILAITLLHLILSATVQTRVSKKRLNSAAKESGVSYGLISGIQKIKLAGAEKRAFARWAKRYSEVAAYEYNPPLYIKLKNVISTAISLAGIIAIYYYAVSTNVSVADYYAFNVAYGMVTGAFLGLAGVTGEFAEISSTAALLQPILEAVPEVQSGKRVVTDVKGDIEISNVSFRYSDDMPLVLNDFSLKIKQGQYVAIVGASGCGKTTLMRLLLGFEVPQRGSIYYDDRDVSTIDLKSLRRKIGVVMQDGKLFAGDIYSNITISAPWLTMEDAWEAAKIAGIDEDIRKMPMGMSTLISEGQGGISGGQRQRVMIARAIAARPRILMFDEATSALDNITQRIVSDSLDMLKCTRIVIAHRLSTIKQCDRIIVMGDGHIIGDGDYDTLLKNNQYFAELVERQRLDATDEEIRNGR